MPPWTEVLPQNIHVVGLAGTEGTAVVDFLLRHGARRITAHDLTRPEDFAQEFARTHQWMPIEEQTAAIARVTSPPVQVRYRDRYLEGIDAAEVIFVSQAWFRHPENARLRTLRDQRRRFSSMTALFFEVSLAPICGVTGTNGKFTVAQLIYDMLHRSGIAAFFSGNDRSHVPMLYVAEQIPKSGWLVLEISNRQLVGLPYSPNLAVITNIAPHHLDDHGTMEAYVETKRTILKYQQPDDVAVLNADNSYTAALAGSAVRPHLFSRTQRVPSGAYLAGDAMVIDAGSGRGTIPLRVLQLQAPHMVENALAAALAASLAGATLEAMTGALADFRGLPYRGRIVGDIEGVVYHEDSLATNPAAAVAGIATMHRPFVLIAGGIRRGARPEDFALMRDALVASPVKAILLIGAAAPILAEALAGGHVPVTIAETLDRAVAMARSITQAGDSVLLSPGCESFDQFRDYRDRGNQFVRLVQELSTVKGKISK